MPATRPHLDRDLKRKQILDAAEKLLLRNGYEATAMAAVARRAGVANNAVYWYFPSKDDLLAAVLQRRQERALAKLPTPATATPDGASPRDARATRSSRQAHSHRPRARPAQHRRRRDARGVPCAADQLLQAYFETPDSTNDAVQAAKAMMALVEGIHLHETNRDTAARDDLVLWTLKQLTGAGSWRRRG